MFVRPQLKVLSLVLFLTIVQGMVLNGLDNSVDDNRYEINSNEKVDPPPHNEYAKVARYIVHKSDWTAMGTISTLKSIEGFPMVNIISVADSPRGGRSTGHIYFLLTNLDYTAQDLGVSNRLTALFSNDQDLACTKNNMDPMEPTCGRIMITGKAIRIDPDNSAIYRVANESFVSRHPASTNWVQEHDFFLCQLEIQQIAVLDYYGGPHYVAPDDYYRADIDETSFRKGSNDILRAKQRLQHPSVIAVPSSQ